MYFVIIVWAHVFRMQTVNLPIVDATMGYSRCKVHKNKIIGIQLLLLKRTKIGV